jgi:hypothetical protein
MDAPLIQLTIAADREGQASFSLTLYPDHPPRLFIDDDERIVTADRRKPLESGDIDGFPASPVTATIVRHFDGLVRNLNGGTFPPGAGRIVLDMPLPFALIPWEVTLGAHTDLTNAAFLRRMPTRQPLRSPLLRFPFGIAVVADRPSTRVDLVFDDFVQKQLPPGIVTDAPPEEAIIWHLIGDSPDMLPHFLEHVPERFPAPRLIVLQRSAPLEPLPIAEAFERGVSAMLLTVADEDRSFAFARTFYRKIFHNQPLERCAVIGIRESGVLPAQAMLYARPGGEFSLLLTRVPLEMTLAGPLELHQRGERAPRIDLNAPEFARPRPAREQRSRRAMALAASAAMRDQQIRELDAPMQHLYQLQFAGEEHDVYQVKIATDAIASNQARDLSVLKDASDAAPTVRYTNLTVKESSTGGACSTNRPLAVEGDYTLDVQIATAPGAAQVRIEFDEAALRQVFEREDRVALDVVVFAPPDEFAVAVTRQRIELPRVGPSTPASFGISPRREGWCRLRVGVYHQNALIQSVALRVYASTSASAAADTGPTIARQLDWVASTDLLLLNEQSAPAVSIFTNDAPDGSHWIGVFAGDEDAPATLRAGQMRKLDSQDLTQRTKDLRDALQAAHGLPDYRYPAASRPDDPDVVQFGIDTLVDLAVRGRQVFGYLFQSMTDVTPQRLKGLRGAIGNQQHGIISIARVDARWTLPWSALYDYPLDVDRRQDLNVCSIFLRQLAANEWDDAGERVVTVNDLLDDPATCRAQSNCPLSGRNADVTICPFGFWGFRNQIEEPLAQVSPAADGEMPREMKNGAYSQSSVIPFTRASGLRIGAGAFPFEHIVDHATELEKLLGSSLTWEIERDKVVQLLYDEHGHHVFYFYCHGVEGKEFSIQVGPAGDLHNLISQASLDLDRFHWAESGNPQPLVVLIACESTAARPETMHGLVGFLRNAMASGVIGSEITIHTSLGRLWGFRLMSALVKGTSVGECFLQLRHELLRRYNPLGLAFSVYAPAALHICHDADGKGACARYHRAPV